MSTILQLAWLNLALTRPATRPDDARQAQASGLRPARRSWPEREHAMYQEYLMKVRHEDRLRAAAQDQLAAQARRARAARRRDIGSSPASRLMRALQDLAHRAAAARQPVLSHVSDEHEQVSPEHASSS
jgi:hypothetical protein